MIKINVALPNGHAEIITALHSSTVQDLKTAAKSSSDSSLPRIESYAILTKP